MLGLKKTTQPRKGSNNTEGELPPMPIVTVTAEEPLIVAPGEVELHELDDINFPQDPLNATEGEDFPLNGNSMNHLTVHMKLGHRFSSATTCTMDTEYGSEADYPDNKCCKCRRSRACSMTLYLWLLLFIAGSISALVIIVSLVILPYRKAGVFVETLCYPETHVLSGDEECTCGKGCTSSYPCLQIIIQFTHASSSSTHNMTNTTEEVTLFDNESFLNKKCSYYPQCKSSRQVNEAAIDRYVQRYGKPGLSYACLYNPDNPAEVIRTRRFQLHHVVHGVVWTSLILLLATILLIYAIKKKGCDFL